MNAMQISAADCWSQFISYSPFIQVHNSDVLQLLHTSYGPIGECPSDVIMHTLGVKINELPERL